MFESNFKLNQIAKVIDCEHKTAPTVDEGIPLIRTPDIDRGRLKSHQARRVTEKTFSQWTRRAVPAPGDLIMAREAPVGNVGIVSRNETVCLGQRTVLIQPDRSKVCPEYLNYVLSTNAMHAYMNMLATGATVGHLNVGDIRKLSLPEFPPIRIQRKIAAILTAYDDLIENNRQRIALLEKMAEEIYCEWFVRLRFPGHEHTPVHKGVPESWEPVRIGDLYKTLSGGTPYRSESRYFSGKIPWVKTGELKEPFIFDTEERITEDAIRNSSAKLLPAGTVVMAMYCAMEDVTILGVEAATNQACCAFRPKESYIGPEFTYQQIRMAIREMTNWSHGAAQQNLSQTLIRAFPVFKPEKGVVKKYCEIAHPLFELTKQLMESTAKLSTTRNLLLNRLISGKLRVDDLDIQFPPSMQAEAA